MNTLIKTLSVATAIFMVAGCSKSKIDKQEESDVAQFTSIDSKSAFSTSFDFKTNQEVDMHVLGKVFLESHGLKHHLLRLHVTDLVRFSLQTLVFTAIQTIQLES